jgi:hypothetical protein
MLNTTNIRVYTLYHFVHKVYIIMILSSLNVNRSHDQNIPYDDVRANKVHQACMSLLGNPGAYSVVCVGSVSFMTKNITATQLKQTLDKCLQEAVLMGKSTFIVLNGANDSMNNEGTTFTSSHWVQNAYNEYKNHPVYRHISFYCIGLAPHSTRDMKAIWMEEYGNTRTKTYINALQAQDRQELLAIYGTCANKVIINEGAKGTLHEVYSMFKVNSSMFTSPISVIINNSSYLINTVIPDTLNNSHSYDNMWLEDLHSTLLALYKHSH